MSVSLSISKFTSAPTSSPKPEPESKFEYSEVRRAALDVPSSSRVEDAPDSILVPLLVCHVSASVRTKSKARGDDRSTLSWFSHIIPGAGCLVDVRSGSTGGGGSVEAEDINVGC